MKIMNKDKEIFGAICKTGHVRREHIESLNIKENRLNTYLEEELVRREVYRGEESYSLTAKGQTLAKEEMGIENHYKRQSHNHDIAIADKYFELGYRERETFLTETELREILRDHIEEVRESDGERAEKIERDYARGAISIPDCAYQNSAGETVVYEVVTANYSKVDIAAKEQYCEEMKMEYQEIRR